MYTVVAVVERAPMEVGIILMTLPPMARHAPGALLALLRAHGHHALWDVAGKVWLMTTDLAVAYLLYVFDARVSSSLLPLLAEAFGPLD
jgi:hypothetical protein